MLMVQSFRLGLPFPRHSHTAVTHSTHVSSVLGTRKAWECEKSPPEILRDDYTSMYIEKSLEPCRDECVIYHVYLLGFGFLAPVSQMLSADPCGHPLLGLLTVWGSWERKS